MPEVGYKGKREEREQSLKTPRSGYVKNQNITTALKHHEM